MISGPIPSPGSTAIFIFPVLYVLSLRLSDQAVVQPGLLHEPLVLELVNLVRVAQREADVVETVQQAELAETRHFERIFGAVAGQHDLALQIDRQLEAVE